MFQNKTKKYRINLPIEYQIISDEEKNKITGGFYIGRQDLYNMMVTVITGPITIPAILSALDGLAIGLAAAVPGLGWLTGGILAACGGVFAVAAFDAIQQNKGLEITLSFPFGLSFTPA